MSNNGAMVFDIVVVGGGHAGIEAALAAQRMSLRTAMITLDKGHIGNMPCNPSVGGPAKGVVTREIDALGGIQAKAADATALQMKMLNSSKGPGVWAIRCQSDKIEYKRYMINAVEESGVTIIESEVVNLLITDSKISGVSTSLGPVLAKAVILTTGTYLRSLTMRGNAKKSEGPDGQKNAVNLSQELSRLGFELLRLKTGTPPRILKSSIDFQSLALEPGTNLPLAFSHETTSFLPYESQQPCYLLHTNDATHELIRNNLHKCSLHNGMVEGVGARYCPSIEDKVVRFADKPRHQLFIEPESMSLDTMYLGGFSTSMPEDLQDQMIRTLPGLQKAVIAKYSYAIEYDAINPIQLYPTLETKLVANLYAAGQINGTSGYEEAACQGLIAGINAGLKLLGREPLVLKRSEAYIGVLIDDLTAKGVSDPYRLLTSRAEHRLHLRNDNAEERLLHHGYRVGLVSEQRMQLFKERSAVLQANVDLLKNTKIGVNSTLGLSVGLKKPTKAYELLRRPDLSLTSFDLLPLAKMPNEWRQKLEIAARFEGYIAAQEKQLERIPKTEQMLIPPSIDYGSVQNISLEAREKLAKNRPYTVGQASRISGINPSDITMLLFHLKRALSPKSSDVSNAKQ